jgi:hypothetical protein
MTQRLARAMALALMAVTILMAACGCHRPHQCNSGTVCWPPGSNKSVVPNP